MSSQHVGSHDYERRILFVDSRWHIPRKSCSWTIRRCVRALDIHVFDELRIGGYGCIAGTAGKLEAFEGR